MVSKSEQKERGSRAIRQMKEFGFSPATVKVVLKSLLTSFDGNWEAIERDNYSVLVDGMFSHDEDQGFIKKTHDDMDDDDIERREECVSDDTALGRKRGGGDQDETSLLKRPRQPDCPEEKHKGKNVLDSSPLSPKKYLLGNNPPQNMICAKEPSNGHDINACQVNGEPSDSGFPTYKPIASFQPPPQSSIEQDDICNKIYCSSVPHAMNHNKNNSLHIRPLHGANNVSKANPSEKDNKEIMNVSQPQQIPMITSVSQPQQTPMIMSVSQPQQTPMTQVEIASSSEGEVKLLLSFNDTSSDIGSLDMEQIMRKIEEKCLRSYKIIQPNFSLVNLMKEMCQTVLELSKSPEDERLINVFSRVDLQKYSSAPNACLSTPSSSNNNCLSLVSVPQHEPALGHIRPLHDTSDICKGEERVRISIRNDIGKEHYPGSFFYIPKNIVYQNGHVDFSLARIGDQDCCPDCFGNCLSASIPCACARETGGEFAYTSDGLIKKKFLEECISRFDNPQKQHLVYCKDCPFERSKNDITPEPCKGHPVRKFIKECWVKCGCNKQCGNRVVQQGITRNLQVFYASEGKGWGLRTLDELPRGAFICEYVGEVLTNTELYERTIKTTGNARHTYPVLLDADWGSEEILKDEEALCLDATFYGNVARFINHRCYDSNLIEIPVEIETPDHHYYHLAFFTKRKIEPLEELTWDYGIDFDDHDHPVKAFSCRCESRFCRNKKKQSRKRGRA